MTKRAVVLGATGQIGRAAVRRLAEEGWAVTAVSRGPREGVSWPDEWAVDTAYADRADDAALAAALGDGCEVLVDCVAYDDAHGRQLLKLAESVGIGSAVVVSSAAVYLDADGWGFDDQEEHALRYPVPIPESQPVVAPGTGTYATRKAALERTLLEAGTLPVTLLRAGAIHGPGSPVPREWYFVKRALDGRRVRLLRDRGENRFHTIAAVNLAELIARAAARPGAGALNAGDPEAPTVRGIAAAIDAVMGHAAEEILADGSLEGELGVTPWSVGNPLVLDMRRAEEVLGYRAVADYGESVGATVDWLTTVTAKAADWRDVFPGYERYLGADAFNYAAEDEWLRSHRRGARGTA